MKIFINKLTDIQSPENPLVQDSPLKDTSFAELVIQALKSANAEGFSVEDMRKRFRIIDIMETAKLGKELKLEDSDAENLKKILTELKWGMVHKSIIELTDHVSKMKKGTK